jgi:copper resistance protein D
MDWLGVGIEDSLIVVRAVHFAASALTAGTLVFGAVIAEPALRSGQLMSPLVKPSLDRVAWGSLALAIITGAIWLQLQTVSMSGLPFAEAMAAEMLGTILNETQFGRVSEFRFALALFLAACLAYDRPGLLRGLGLAAALGLLAAIAWTGHAGSTPGALGTLQVTADALHLCAAGAWIGGLVPLVLLLGACRRKNASPWNSLAQEVVKRFSLLGMFSVATLLTTGILNAWILVGSFHLLLITSYGQLLMLKIGLFALMLAFAAINRFWWTPRLVLSTQTNAESLRQLTRNSVFEIVLGVAIFAIVGALGTMHPAIHGV